MSIKHVLVSLMRFHSNESAVRAAIALARGHDAALSASVADDGRALGPAGAEGTASRACVAGRNTKVRRRFDVGVVGGARSADLGPRAERDFHRLLRRSSHPVLMIPSLQSPTDFVRVAVVWETGGAASRQIDDTIAFLPSGASIDLLTFVPEHPCRWRGEEAFVAAAQRLVDARFGVMPSFVRGGPSNVAWPRCSSCPRPPGRFAQRGRCRRALPTQPAPERNRSACRLARALLPLTPARRPRIEVTVIFSSAGAPACDAPGTAVMHRARTTRCLQ